MSKFNFAIPCRTVSPGDASARIPSNLPQRE